MMKKTISAICAFFAFTALAYIGMNIGPSYAEVEAFMESPEYKRQEAAHFARLARMEAAAQKRMEGKR